MLKIALAVSAAATLFTTTPLVTPAKAAGVKMAQVDVQIGRDRDYRYDSDRRYYRDRDTTVGVGPGSVTIGPRERCRMVTRSLMDCLMASISSGGLPETLPSVLHMTARSCLICSTS